MYRLDLESGRRLFHRSPVLHVSGNFAIGNNAQDKSKQYQSNSISLDKTHDSLHILDSFPGQPSLRQVENTLISTSIRPENRENPGLRIEGQEQKRPERIFRVTIIDNDYNTYEQVIRICMKALSVGFEEALQIAVAVDNNGEAEVFHGDETSALQVAEVIRSIGIEVRVAPLD
ncbi:MAG TPA: hypothetical protein DEA96_07850 [Leptospiraceae bacterium]|nr:hypothetical protein [Spirochaetaceae bacterium]HBS04860.1 hypothetical protein [Leptospiraceae bacterium]